MGDRFLEMASLLPFLSILMTFVAVANLFIMYFLALRRYFLIPILIISSLAIAITTIVWHNSIEDIVMNLMYGVVSALAVMVIFYLREPKT